MPKTSPDNETTKITSKFADLRLQQNYLASAGLEEVITSIRIGKPNKQAFVRTHTDRTFRYEAMVIDFEEDRNIYLVGPSLYSALASFTKPVCLWASITKQGAPFLWMLNLPQSADQSSNTWNDSALEAARLAEKGWVQVASDRNMSAYRTNKPQATFDDPKWPNLTMDEWLEIAFRDKVINDENHPVYRKLLGLAV